VVRIGTQEKRRRGEERKRRRRLAFGHSEKKTTQHFPHTYVATVRPHPGVHEFAFVVGVLFEPILLIIGNDLDDNANPKDTPSDDVQGLKGCAVFQLPTTVDVQHGHHAEEDPEHLEDPENCGKRGGWGVLEAAGAVAEPKEGSVVPGNECTYQKTSNNCHALRRTEHLSCGCKHETGERRPGRDE